MFTLFVLHCTVIFMPSASLLSLLLCSYFLSDEHKPLHYLDIFSQTFPCQFNQPDESLIVNNRVVVIQLLLSCWYFPLQLSLNPLLFYLFAVFHYTQWCPDVMPLHHWSWYKSKFGLYCFARSAKLIRNYVGLGHLGCFFGTVDWLAFAQMS